MHKLRRAVGVFVVLLGMTLTVNACTGSTVPPGSSTFTSCSQPDYVTTWAVPAVVRANGKAVAKVTAANYNDCQPVPGAKIQFQLHGVCGTLSVNSGVTDSKGLVATKYRASSKVGTCEICGTWAGTPCAPSSFAYAFGMAVIKQQAP